MPRHPESPPHLDPFPPLPLSRPPNPTYASITASSSRPPLPSPGPPQLGWSAEDVDRSERLDELNPYPSVIPAGPSPPWRRGETAAGPSTPTAQSRRASRMITPMFTLDELLGNANPSPPSGPPRPRAPSEPATVTSGAHRHYANPFSLPGYQDVWPSGDARRERQGSWDGPSDAARRLGYVPAPTTISAPATSNATAARGETDGPMGTVARRHRPRIFRPSHPAYDPEEVLPSPNDLYAMENEDGEGEDHPWLVRSGRARLYQHENTTGDDLDGWGRAEGSATGSLSRGRNNRRRRSLVERREAEEDERVGLQPTNVDVARGSEPLIVRSNGVRRQREESEVEVINGLATKLRKRRKLEAIQKATVTVPSHYPGYLSYSTLDPSTPLPCSFVPPTRPSRLALTTIFVPGRPGPMRPKITFTTHPTPRQNDTDAAALRTHEPIPVSCGVHYFEAEVLNQGEEGFMSIGWMKAGLELGRLVGWDRGSWGWHGDDGMSFEGAPLGESFSEKWGTGDTVGCGIDFGTGRAFFTKNGKFVGHRFKNLSSGLHPAIGLRTPREAIAVSFCGPFLFDIDGYVRKLRDEAWSVATRPREVAFAPRLCDQTSARRVPIDVDSVQAETAKDKKPDRIPKTSPLRGPEDKTTAAFVLDYLAHNGYDKALRLTKEEMTRRQWLNPRPPVIDTQSLLTHTRTDDDGNRTGTPSLSARLINLHSQVTNAHTTAIPWDLIDSLDPWRQYRPDSLSHRLEIQDFLRLLRQADDLPEPEAEVLDDEAIHRGKRLLGRSKEESWSAEDRKLLDQVFGLLGIPVSEWDSGPGSVAGEERRRADADELVAHIRREKGMNQRSWLEQGMRQAVLVGKRLAEVDGSAGLVDVRRIWEREREKPAESGGEEDGEWMRPES